MRKSEMSLEQAAARSAIVEQLERAGWTPPSNENEMFDKGMWVLREVALTYRGTGAALSVYYRGDQDALYLGFTMTDGRSTELKMRADQHLREILDVIITHQDHLSSATFREPIRAFMDAGVEVFASKDGDTFLRLTDNRRGSSSPASN